MPYILRSTVYFWGSTEGGQYLSIMSTDLSTPTSVARIIVILLLVSPRVYHLCARDGLWRSVGPTRSPKQILTYIISR